MCKMLSRTVLYKNRIPWKLAREFGLRRAEAIAVVIGVSGRLKASSEARDRRRRPDSDGGEPVRRADAVRLRRERNRTLVRDSTGGVTTSAFDAEDRLTSRQLGGAGITPERVD